MQSEKLEETPVSGLTTHGYGWTRASDRGRRSFTLLLISESLIRGRDKKTMRIREKHF